MAILRQMSAYLLAPMAAALTVVSWWLIFWAANEEPFFGRPDVRSGLLCVGLGSILLFLWIVWSGGVVAAVATRQMHRVFLLTLLLPLATIPLLKITVVGYLEDVAAAYDLAAEGE